MYSTFRENSPSDRMFETNQYIDRTADVIGLRPNLKRSQSNLGFNTNINLSTIQSVQSQSNGFDLQRSMSVSKLPHGRLGFGLSNTFEDGSLTNRSNNSSPSHTNLRTTSMRFGKGMMRDTFIVNNKITSKECLHTIDKDPDFDPKVKFYNNKSIRQQEPENIRQEGGAS